MKKNIKKVSNILMTFGLVLLLISVIGGLAILSNGFTSTPKQFYLRQGDEVLFADRDNYEIVQNRMYKFEIINTYSDNDDYIITITPNVTAETNFTFKVDGEAKNYADVDSLMKGFDVSAGVGYFTLKANNYELNKILERCYPGKTITEVPSVNNLVYFKLTVSTKDKANMLEIKFRLSIDPDAVIPVDPDKVEDKGDIGDLPEKPVELDKYK